METPDQEMCPNCVTPWKCNGPHIVAHDNVNSPKHYVGKNGMEVIDVIDAFDLDLYQGSIVQYIIRYKHKNGIEDVRKAYWYISRLLDRLEKQNVALASNDVGNQSNYSTRLHPISSGMGGVPGVYLREEGLRVGTTGSPGLRDDQDKGSSCIGREHLDGSVEETERAIRKGPQC